MVIALPLGGCNEHLMFKGVTSGIVSVTEGIFMRPDVNLKQKNEAAADFLVQNFNKAIRQDDLIEIRHLHEMDNNTLTSPLGMKISEDIGMRLNHLGYRVNLRDTATGPNKVIYEKIPDPLKAADFTLMGSYLRNRKDVDVYLRVVNARTGEIISAFDYKMYLTAEMRKLSETPVRIYRTGAP